MSTKIILAASSAGIERATEPTMGGLWSVETAFAGADVRCLASDPLNPLTVFAGTHGGGVLRSDDAGQTWRSAGLAGQSVRSLAVSRLEPGTVYVGTKPALMYVSRDGGATWDELTAFRRIRSRWMWFSPAEKPFTAYVQSIALSPHHPGVIIAGIEAGAVVRSADGGKTWKDHRPGALRDCHMLLSHPFAGGWVYEGGGTGGGVAISRDDGLTWEQPRKGLEAHYGWAVAADCERPEVVYLSVAPGPFKAHINGRAEAAVYRATGGAGWQKLGGGLPNPLTSMPYALMPDPLRAGGIYAGLGNGDVWHSEDYGENWTKLPVSLKVNRSMVLLSV